MKKPQFITFTGPDADTNINDMVKLSNDYDVEFGILFSPTRQGLEPRYPDFSVIERMITRGLKLAAHICGDYARTIVAGEQVRELEWVLPYFDRAQINTAPGADPAIIKRWADKQELTAILQCRDQFPSDLTVQWLFDASGGRGLEPAAWPEWNGSPWLHGYAGGLKPDNVENLMQTLDGRESAHQFWIDMVSGVRDANDRFDLSKCRQVCELVFDKPTRSPSP